MRDRLQLLLTNGWQGLILATFMLLLFFSWRYTFWIALGLPISFLGGLAMMVVFGVSINMISMVALLMAIGILMDDAIVLSENIDHEYRKGKSPLDAAIDGTKGGFSRRLFFLSYIRLFIWQLVDDERRSGADIGCPACGFTVSAYHQFN